MLFDTCVPKIWAMHSLDIDQQKHTKDKRTRGSFEDSVRQTATQLTSVMAFNSYSKNNILYEVCQCFYINFIKSGNLSYSVI
jgi:hypothetical protein